MTAIESVLIGLDVGSTTCKLVVMNREDNNILYQKYERHNSDVTNTIICLFDEARDFIEPYNVSIYITGSGGQRVATVLHVPFLQEVVACSEAVRIYLPETDVAIELGGEDAKLSYFEGEPGSREMVASRMNGSCAGGTGAFIDTMAILLKTDASGLNELARAHTRLYPIASRCGVFAKSDIQPLLNEGARREDVAASILQAVVNQTIGGLAMGRPIKGKIAFLGGPLFFLPSLRDRFIDTLTLTPETTLIPPNGHFFVAIGSALCAKRVEPFSGALIYRLLPTLRTVQLEENPRLAPLFEDAAALEAFNARHAQAKVVKGNLEEYEGAAFVGIDAGSTTTKVALISEAGELLWSHYGFNQGSPLQSTIDALSDMYAQLPDTLRLCGSCSTGYGEHLIQEALHVDRGEIETVAHFKGAAFFKPDVETVIDIGGQDMKMMTVTHVDTPKGPQPYISSVKLNEACSSGCGSFISTYAESIGLTIQQFTAVGIKARAPVDLGSRCTVFVSSRVKQAQKEGATLEDISAGISISIIKNAIHKVIRLRNASELGKHIVCEGGTFLSATVLRAFEMLTGVDVIRPDISGIMGAFGAALTAKEHWDGESPSQMLGRDALTAFSWEHTTRRCEKCLNHCLLTINTFPDGGQFVSGNRCERGAGVVSPHRRLPNIYDWKARAVFSRKSLPIDKAPRGRIGIPRVMNMYEDYPFWHSFFTELGFRVESSSRSSKKIFEKGIETITSDTVCYPAKLAHGHIQDLVDKGITRIWYPNVPRQKEMMDTGPGKTDLVADHPLAADIEDAL
eukprot:gnl/Dysnectes_brevis/718_a791_3092.p1 GENE.gnl/Dysnectes_brevis/718_a791_3092~~gnl/Dysnectes_brevis/718_a791_3092.p1  ORF type:complete len:808 (-),score=294.87 gnl/Dysnectes_brevis/718_a791_3092:167-2554(-)